MGSLAHRAQNWFKTKVFEPVQEWLKSGAEPNILARSAGVGFALGLCPLLGVSTMLCVGALALARLVRVEMHAAMALLANLLAVPVELALIVMHMRVGEFLLGAPHLEVVRIRLSDLWAGDLGKDLLLGVAHAMLGWLVLLPLEAAAVGLATYPLFTFLKKKFMPFAHERLPDRGDYSFPSTSYSGDELELGRPDHLHHHPGDDQQDDDPLHPHNNNTHTNKGAERAGQAAFHARRSSAPLTGPITEPPVVTLAALPGEEEVGVAAGRSGSSSSSNLPGRGSSRHARSLSVGMAQKGSADINESLL